MVDAALEHVIRAEPQGVAQVTEVGQKVADDGLVVFAVCIPVERCIDERLQAQGRPRRSQSVVGDSVGVRSTRCQSGVLSECEGQCMQLTGRLRDGVEPRVGRLCHEGTV